MALRFYVPLPGPFTYSKRIGGGGRKGKPLDAQSKGYVLLFCVAVFLIAALPWVMIPLLLIGFAVFCYLTVKAKQLEDEAAVEITGKPVTFVEKFYNPRLVSHETKGKNSDA